MPHGEALATHLRSLLAIGPAGAATGSTLWA